MVLGYLISPVVQIVDNNGKPIVGAKIYVYKAGTTNTVNTYRDFSNHYNTTPVLTDTLGNCTIIAPDDMIYDIVVKDNRNNLLMSKDNLTVSSGINPDINLRFNEGYGIIIRKNGNTVTIAVDTDIIATKDDLAAKQDKLTAGDNIDITNNNIINVVNRKTLYTQWPLKVDRGSSMVKLYLDDDYADQFKTKQSTVEYGADGKYISYISQNENGEIEATTAALPQATTYSAGTDLKLFNGVFSVDTDSIVTGTQNFAAGHSNNVSGSYNAAFGAGNSAKDERNFVYGYRNAVQGYSNLAGGIDCSVSGSSNIIIGQELITNGAANAIFGAKHNIDGANANYNVVAGYNNKINGGDNNIFGYNNNVTANYCGIIGNDITLTADNSYAFGQPNSAVDGGFVFGSDSKNDFEIRADHSVWYNHNNNLYRLTPSDYINGEKVTADAATYVVLAKSTGVYDFDIMGNFGNSADIVISPNSNSRSLTVIVNGDYDNPITVPGNGQQVQLKSVAYFGDTIVKIEIFGLGVGSDIPRWVYTIFTTSYVDRRDYYVYKEQEYGI